MRTITLLLFFHKQVDFTIHIALTSFEVPTQASPAHVDLGAFEHSVNDLKQILQTIESKNSNSKIPTKTSMWLVVILDDIDMNSFISAQDTKQSGNEQDATDSGCRKQTLALRWLESNTERCVVSCRSRRHHLEYNNGNIPSQ